jgi:hypothetical protein
MAKAPEPKRHDIDAAGRKLRRGCLSVSGFAGLASAAAPTRAARRWGRLSERGVGSEEPRANPRSITGSAGARRGLSGLTAPIAPARTIRARSRGEIRAARRSARARVPSGARRRAQVAASIGGVHGFEDRPVGFRSTHLSKLMPPARIAKRGATGNRQPVGLEPVTSLWLSQRSLRGLSNLDRSTTHA